MNQNLTVAVLLYGDHFDLHRRCLKSLYETCTRDIELRIGLNQVGDQTLSLLDGMFADHPGGLGAWLDGLDDNWGWMQSEGFLCFDRIRFFAKGRKNVGKYPMMRKMFAQDPNRMFPDLPFGPVVWLDDDTWFESGSEWLELVSGLMTGEDPAQYVGVPYRVNYDAGEVDAVKAMPWYSGVEIETEKRGRIMRPCVTFATGGFVGLRTELIRRLDWPPACLHHNGGDTLLGQAVRQARVKHAWIRPREHGIRVNDAPRRGISERPYGCLHDIRR